MDEALFKNNLNSLEKVLFKAIASVKDAGKISKQLAEINDLTQMLISEMENNAELKAILHRESKEKNLLETASFFRKLLLDLQRGVNENLAGVNKLCTLLEQFREQRNYLFRNKRDAVRFVEKMLYYNREESAVLKPSIKGIAEMDELEKLCNRKIEGEAYEVLADKLEEVITKALMIGIKDFIIECGDCKLIWKENNTITAKAKPEKLRELDAIAVAQNAVLK